MKTRRISKMFIVALVVVFFTGGIVVAKSIKVTLEDEVMCREPALVKAIIACPGGTPIIEDGVITGCLDGRYHVRDGQNLWLLSGDNDLLDGSMILHFNVNMDGPPPLKDRNGLVFGAFELVPDYYCETGDAPCPEYTGSWVGTYNSHYKDGWVESSFVGHGTGELEGLKMKSYDMFELMPPPSRCKAGGFRPFTVEIHDPKGEFF